jgi:anti-sigma28 factor (negative regulator of flagellin synthesis)
VQDGRNTTALCRVPVSVPLDRIQFVIPAEQVNFRRNVTVNAGENQAANGEISRVRMTRAGTQVVSEQMSVDLPDFRDMRETKVGEIKVTIANGDDPPLPLLSVQPLARERRIYFDPGGRSVLKMYYGDPQLQAPVYDYAKFFQEESDAAQAQLGRAMHNAEYAGRPDGRPWSERHKAVLWATMLLAVAALAILAVRGLANPKSVS